MKILYIRQTDVKDCGVSCLMAIIRYYGGYVSREYLRDITNTTREGTSVYSLVECAKKIGMEARALKGDINKLNNFPLIAHVLLDEKLGHFVVVVKKNSKYITVMDPNCGFKKYTYSNWQKISTNVYLLYYPKENLLRQPKEKKSFSSIISFLKLNKFLVLLVFLFSLLYTFCNLFLSYQFELFLQTDIKNLTYVLVFLLLIFFLKEFLDLFRNILVQYFHNSLSKKLLKEVYSHIIRLPYIYFKNRTKGDIFTRIQDVFKISEFYSKLFTTIFLDTIFLIIFWIFLWKINLKIAIFILFISLLYTGISLLYQKVLIPIIKDLKEKESIVNNHIIETLSSISTIKSMQLEDYFDNKMNSKYTELLGDNFSFEKIFQQSLFIKNIIYGGGLLFLIFICVKEVFNGSISYSHLLVIYSISFYFFIPIQNICDLGILYKDIKVSRLRIHELLNIEGENLLLTKKKLERHLIGKIQIFDLEYSYINNKIINCKKLLIYPGEKILLYGNSGGGKSTLMKLISKYIDYSKGKIYIDKRELSEYDIYDIRKRITYVSQDEVLYTDTVYNNIVLNNLIPYEKYLEIIKITGVDNIIQRSILKDEMILENNACNLSGGEKQRIILARSLVKNSDIYIFDESMSSIDIRNERILLKNIFKYLQTKTVIIISHRFNNRDLYQRFVLVNNGEVYEY